MAPSPLKPHDLIVILLDQANVAICNTKPVLAALQALSVDAYSVRHYASRITFVFDGYGNQTEELYENPRVRAFVQKLTEQFPYWLHFISKSDDALFVLFMCMMGDEHAQVGSKSNGRVQLELNTAKFNSVLMDWFGYLNRLHAEHGLSDAETSAMTAQVKVWVDRVFAQR
jgi:hypothetical protein